MGDKGLGANGKKGKRLKGKKTRRGRKGKVGRVGGEGFTIFGNNAASLTSKMKSFEFVVKDLKPDIFMIQESKFTRKGKLNHLKDYEIFEKLRENVKESNRSGGLAVGVHKNYAPFLIPDETDSDKDVDILTVQVNVENKDIRFISAYGP